VWNVGQSTPLAVTQFPVGTDAKDNLIAADTEQDREMVVKYIETKS